MKLIYATSISYPSTLANRIQTLAMAREFRRLLGDDFILGGKNLTVLATAKAKGSQDGQGSQVDEYGTVVSFGISKSFILGWKYASLAKRFGATHIYCREHRLLAFIQLYNALFFRRPLAYYFEAHDMPARGLRLFVKTLRRCAGVVAITRGLKEALIEVGIDRRSILVAPDGIDLARFGATGVYTDTASARMKLGLLETASVALYAGHLYAWKGADTLAEAAKILGNAVQCVFVGGKERDIAEFKARHRDAENVILTGPKPHADIPACLAAADVLILPNSAKEDISRLYTSPMKMFEYMASGKPIVASDLPSIREVLGPHNAVLCAPDDPKSLAAAIRSVLADPAAAQKRAAQAAADVKAYTWEKRAGNVLGFMGEKK